MDDFWSGRTVVVSGAARGQGAAEVRALFDAGACVIALDLDDDPAHWEGLCEHCRSDPQRLRIQALDVADEVAWAALAGRLRAEGVALHGLINNAGITLRKTVTQTSAPEWERVMAVNLSGAFFAIHHLAGLMPAGASIVNISSTAGLTGYFSAAYTASKWGLRGLTKAAAIELAQRQIRVNCICPGLVDTPMTRTPNAEHDAARAAQFYEGNRLATPLGRGADPQEIAQVALFLLSPQSSYITAADIPVEGGMIGGGLYWQIGLRSGSLQAGA